MAVKWWFRLLRTLATGGWPPPRASASRVGLRQRPPVGCIGLVGGEEWRQRDTCGGTGAAAARTMRLGRGRGRRGSDDNHNTLGGGDGGEVDIACCVSKSMFLRGKGGWGGGGSSQKQGTTKRVRGHHRPREVEKGVAGGVTARMMSEAWCSGGAGAGGMLTLVFSRGVDLDDQRDGW